MDDIDFTQNLPDDAESPTDEAQIKEHSSKQEELILEAKTFIDSYKKELKSSLRDEHNVIYIDFMEIAEESPALSEEIVKNPEEALRILELAIEEMGLSNNVRARLSNLPKSNEVLIRNIRAKHLNELIVIEGIIRQSSDVRPQVVNAKFECPSCGTVIAVLQMEKKFREPSRCSCGRRGGFKLISKEMVDTQRLIIEEAPDMLSGGEQPKRIDVFVKEDLVDPKMEERTTPGSRAKVIGVLKEVPVPLPSGGLSTRFQLAIEVNNIIPMEETFEELDISEEDEIQIKELAADPFVFEKLKESIAPSVWGYKEIKESLLLQLFGGVQKEKSDGQKSRGDIHIMMIGDPGVAKSVILNFIANISPKGRYVVGKSTSGAGLTASVVKDEFLRGWSLEAGAMVLANKGIVCIDELEKMDQTDQSAMHEAMEQQCMMPNFKLLLSNGEEVEIGKLVDNLLEKEKKKVIKGKDCEILPVQNIELLSTDFQNHFPSKANRISRHIAPKEFIKITLTNGREITVTPEHPCWIVKNGKITTIPAEKLNEKMFFPIPSKIKIKSKNYIRKNDYLCKILGYHISDGCYELNRKKKTGVQFWNNNETLIKDYFESIEKYFNKKPIITKRKNQFAVRVISKKVVEEFKKLNENLLEKGDKKEIPKKIMQLPKENIKYLLRALYDGDGTVTYQKRGGCRISFVSQNKNLEKQMADLLLRFGIQSSIFEDKHSKVWRLDISGQENIGKFFLEISFLSEKKRQRLKEYHEKNKTYRTIKDIIPNCTNKINEIFKKLKISQRKEIGHSIDLGVEKQRKFLQKLVLIAETKLNKNLKENPELLKEYSGIIDDLENIKKLTFGFARWMKIKKVEKIKNKNTKWVYDVTIEPHHTFISNGMILHNTVTISKANVQASLRAQTSVLAAANPKFGRFDPTQGIPQQINLPPALINRFDVIFTLRDVPNLKNDVKVADHILSEHQQEAKEMLIEKNIFRKYIAYARQRVIPKLTDESVQTMKDFYVNLRNRPMIEGQEMKTIPISARQLNSLIRMAEAAAKIRMSDKVEKKDAEIAINLTKFFLEQAGMDEDGNIDMDRISGKITSSARNKIFTVRDAISQLTKEVGELIPEEKIIEKLEGKMSEEEIEDSLGKLKRAGTIFSPRRGFVQKV
jgi:replicative DNA helicase Mcm